MSTLMLVGGFFSVILLKPHTADPVADLTDRLRNPRRRVIWMITHPIVAFRSRA